MHPRLSFDWRDLEVFMTVAEVGSIARAAERCNTVASAVSKRLSDLESALETPLLERHSRGVALTTAGRALLARSAPLLEQARQLDREIRGYGTGARGLVRVFANISSIVEFLPAALAGFTREHPEILIHLEEHVSIQIAQAVAERVADFGVISDLPRWEGLELKPFRTDELVLVTPQNHPLAEQDHTLFEAALDFPLVGLHVNSTLHTRLLQVGAALGRELNMRIHVTSFDAVCAMVAAGLGVGVAPRTATLSYVSTMGLKTIALDDAWAKRQLYLCTRSGEKLPLVAQLLYEHLAAID